MDSFNYETNKSRVSADRFKLSTRHLALYCQLYSNIAKRGAHE